MAENLYLPDLPASPMFEGDESKVMTIEWLEFFRSLYNRVGGIDGPVSSDIERNTIAETYLTPQNYTKRIDDLERLIRTLAISKSYDKDVKELRQLLEALIPPKSYDKEIAELKTLVYTLAREPFKFYLPQIVYEDLQVSISTIRLPAANAPTWRQYNHGIGGGVTFAVLGYDVGDISYFDIQTHHAMQLSRVLDNHIHWCTPNDGTGKKFQFQLDVIAAPINGNWAALASSPFTIEEDMAADYSNTHKLLEVGNLDAVNTTVSTIYKCRFERIAASVPGDEYGSEVYLEYTDCHYPKDSCGSKLEGEK